jgi:capsular polysaccharide export protein
LCFDNKDLYFNAISNNPSDLKNILKQSTNSFFLERAKKLQEKIIHHHITKYNTDIITPIDVPDSKHIIFVAGQVTHDASLVYGDLPPHIQQDYDLLKQVKEDYPESYILYKPHPDTMTGNRKHGDKYHLCHHFYNQIETQASVLSCISVANLIVTMTSQVGFDALVRRKKVKAYGSPFYKDFSDDIEEKPKSSLSLEHLIYSALIEYPLYHNGKSFIMPEDAVDMIIARKNLLEKSYRYTIMQLKLFKFLYKVKKWVF